MKVPSELPADAQVVYQAAYNSALASNRDPEAAARAAIRDWQKANKGDLDEPRRK